MKKSTILGIDLGTSKICVSGFVEGKLSVIQNDIGESVTPSYISFTDKEILIGKSAKNQMTRNPKKYYLLFNGINRKKL